MKRYSIFCKYHSNENMYTDEHLHLRIPLRNNVALENLQGCKKLIYKFCINCLKIQIMEQHSTTPPFYFCGVKIRAPVLYRLLANIYTLTIKTPEVFLGQISNDLYSINTPGIETDDKMILSTMVYQMSVYKRPGTGFPTKHMDLLATALMRIVKCYIDAPYIYSKINTLWAAQLVSSAFLSHNKMDEVKQELRAQEIKDMNDAFYNLSLFTNGIKVVASCEMLNVTETILNPDSEFVFFSVKTV